MKNVKTPAGPMGDSAMMSPRKAMGMGKLDSGAGAVGDFATTAQRATSHPDKATGSKGHMQDGARGIGTPVSRGKGQHPGQASPDHGPTHPGGHGMHKGYSAKL